MSWINYLLEANLYMVLFYGVYYFVLRKDTYYQLNRIYLLITSLVSFIIPLLQIGVLKPIPVVLPLTQVTASYINTTTVHRVVGTPIAAPAISINYYLILYIAVATILTIALGARLFQLFRLARKGRHTAATNFNIIEIEDEDHAFSFFNYLFIGAKLSTSATIIQHELVHIRQKHSIDIIYLELLKIICWFNPVVYLLQNSMKEVHEFIADNHIAHNQQAVNDYTNFLVNAAYGLSYNTLTNNFFNKNLLKTRIMMLHQKRSGSLARLKYLVALPLLAGMLCLSTLGFTKNYKVIDLAPADTTIKRPPPPPPAPPIQKPGKVPPPPAPVFLSPAYNGLGNYMQVKLQYPKEAYSKKVVGTVILDFVLDNNGKINDVKVAKGLGSGLDEEAVRLIRSYKSPIKDKAGSHSIGINFNIKGSRFPEITSPEMKNKPGFVGEFFLPGTPLGENRLKFPPPVVKPDVKPVKGPNIAPQTDEAVDTINKNPYESFNKYIGRSVRYPTAARDNNIQGEVYILFNVDTEGNTTNIGIINGLTDDINNEVVRVIKAYKPTPDFKTGINYGLTVSFSISDKNSSDSNADRKAAIAYTKTKSRLNIEDYNKPGFTYLFISKVAVVSYAVKK